ncbi:hypothetical protein BDB01DRAFT_726386, partial [Pilobolus umbonatus]
DESDLIRKMQEEAALDKKYQEDTKKRDAELEERFKSLSSDPPQFSTQSSHDSKPRGKIPTPVKIDDLYDEVDDWCCKFEEVLLQYLFID